MTRFVVGIDLGTTNSALAYVDAADPDRRVTQFAVPQLVGEGTLGERPSLPSFLYLGGEHDVAPGSLGLPWDRARTYAVGEFAREQGARVPGRLISSAKSWLCHGGVDREASILPWAAPEDVARLSPVQACARYLRHLSEVWSQRFPDAPLAAQDVILTVPASFDEVARELTVQAAAVAELPHIVLLEEPQAAFYAWLHRHETTWAETLESCRRILVVDVGGGTTDFSLIRVGRDDGRLVLERLAVGDHLLLGGDNVDVALARVLEPRFGAQLDSLRWHALVNVCRAAKETLLGIDPPAEIPVRLVGRGRSLVGGTLTATLQREEVARVVLDGFFCLTPRDAMPRRIPRLGLQEFGLPFASDPEISRHLALFLRQHRADAGDGTEGWPDAILFNGGALTPPVIRDRLCDLLANWNDGRPPAVLSSVDLDLAVARGAAYYGLVRRGKGVRIGGGTARAYYVGIGTDPGSTTSTATPSPEAQIKALCVVPRGMHEGEEVEIADPALDVLTNRGVSFPLYASSTRLGDRSGEVVTAARESLNELPPIRTVLRFGKKLVVRKLPVHVVARLNEIGTLEISCRSLTTDHRWRLQFQLREPRASMPDGDAVEAEADAQAVEAIASKAQLAAACDVLRGVFPDDPTAPAGDPISLTRVIEERLGGGKDAWSTATVRHLWDVLWQRHAGRAVSAAHEARWLNLCGYLLRPGFGAELDAWRIEQLWKLKAGGLRFPKAAQVRAEWWNMWKRVAGGLSRQQQGQLLAETAPWLLPRLKAKTKGQSKPGPQEIREYWQVVGSCERLASEQKAELGEVLLASVLKGKTTDVEIWALGRLGARAPLYGPLNSVVSRNTVSGWVEALLQISWANRDAIAFTIVQLARSVNDRERDLDAALRERVAARLEAAPGGHRAARLVREFVPLESQERSRILDESLPAGFLLRDALAASP